MVETKSSVLRSVQSLRDYELTGADGAVGDVVDLLFDDRDWVTRYLVIETGGWLTGRQFLFSPEALDEADWEGREFHAGLKREVFERSPGIDLERPVSRQQIVDLHEHFSWPVWHNWAMGTRMQPLYYPMLEDLDLNGTAGPDVEDLHGRDGSDPHLRSAGEVMGYRLLAHDGEIGTLDDFFVGDTGWKLQYLKADTDSLFPGRKLLISTAWITEIDFRAKEVSLDLRHAQIENCPEYVPAEPDTAPFSLAFYRSRGFDPYLIRFTS